MEEKYFAEPQFPDTNEGKTSRTKGQYHDLIMQNISLLGNLEHYLPWQILPPQIQTTTTPPQPSRPPQKNNNTKTTFKIAL